MIRNCLPLITIAITCYNAQDTIGRAVLSAIRQSWPNREIIIVDDCSTDGSWDVIQDLTREFSELRAVRQESNRGYAATCNRMLARARGEFIAFFDDDDESATDRIERQYERIIGYEESHGKPPVFCYSSRNVVRSGETEVSFHRFGIGRQPPEPAGRIVAAHIFGLITDGGVCWGMFGGCVSMARIGTYRVVNGFDESFRRLEDIDIAVRAAFKGAHFISVDAPLITQHLTETPDKADAVTIRYRRLLLSKHRAHFDSKKTYWAAIANNYASFHHSKENHWRGHMWRGLALLLFPWRVSLERLASRRYRREQRRRVAGYNVRREMPTREHAR